MPREKNVQLVVHFSDRPHLAAEMIAMVPYFRRNVAHRIVGLWMFASECESLRLARPIWMKGLRGRAGLEVRM